MHDQVNKQTKIQSTINFTTASITMKSETKREIIPNLQACKRENAASMITFPHEENQNHLEIPSYNHKKFLQISN